MASTALSRNPFARPAAKAKDALATARAAAAKKIAAVEEASKKQIANARAGSYKLAVKAKESAASVGHDEGIRLGGHLGGFMADYFAPGVRAGKSPGVMNVLGRPSAALALVGFGGAMFTKGETRFYMRNVGQGALHAVAAVAFRQIANALSPGAADRSMGDAQTGDAAGEADY